MSQPTRISILFIINILIHFLCFAQPITGVWKGSNGRFKMELKIIKKGDSLTGSVYYYISANNYRRFSIKGYFDPRTNDAIWWDDLLLEDKLRSGLTSESGPAPMMNMADFNCPGEDIMRLDGNSFQRDEKKKQPGSLNLQKKKGTQFPDEWDWVITNYTIGANDPEVIDSIGRLSSMPREQAPVRKAAPPRATAPKSEQAVNNSLFIRPAPEEEKKKAAPPAQTPEEKFASRKKVLEQVIPLQGDSIELRFYDNGEIDGDSIAFFMNGNLIFKHVMITDRAYTVKFAVKDLEEDNEAVMVAENLGSIPPNTALLIAIVGGKQYEAHLYADENSSAEIRFVKEIAKPTPR